MHHVGAWHALRHRVGAGHNADSVRDWRFHRRQSLSLKRTFYKIECIRRQLVSTRSEAPPLPPAGRHRAGRSTMPFRQVRHG
jgi:hypothetical protein